jgi:hypothetical protein
MGACRTHNHHGCRYVRFAVPHRSQCLQYVHQRSIVFGGSVDQRREANSTVSALNVEVVFERDWEAVQRSFELTSST